MTNSPWISVKDRLPEGGKTVIAMLGGAIPVLLRYLGGTWYTEGQRVRECVTHWMPLPDPPKPEDPFETWWNKQAHSAIHGGMDKRRVVTHLDTFVYEAEARAIWNAAIESQKK